MKDTIYRQEAINAMDCVTDSICAQQAIDALIGLPSAERRGRWEQVGDNAYRCSACGEISCCNSPFCSECGAKIEGEEE